MRRAALLHYCHFMLITLIDAALLLLIISRFAAELTMLMLMRYADAAYAALMLPPLRAMMPLLRCR